MGALLYQTLRESIVDAIRRDQARTAYGGAGTGERISYKPGADP